MLMSRELHNWLLLMALKLAKAPSQNPPSPFAQRYFENDFQFHNLFHSPDPEFQLAAASPTP